MKGARKDLQQEMWQLRWQLKMLLRKNAEGRQRSEALLRDLEQKIEDHFATLDALQSTNEFAAIKFRKNSYGSVPAFTPDSRAADAASGTGN